MNSIFYENSKTPKFVDSNAKLPSAAKEALEMASENARLLNSFLKDADSTADKLAVAPKSMQNIKMQVKKQILNNMKLLSKIFFSFVDSLDDTNAFGIKYYINFGFDFRWR